MAKRPPYPKLTAVPADGDESTYEVGYGRPPKATRFKPGQSGNPFGRPKGARTRSNGLPALNEERMKTVVQEEAYRTIGVRDGDRLVEIPVIQAVIRSVALNAAKGHQRSQHMFTELLQWVERENRKLHEQWLDTAIEYKLGWEKELRRCEALGVKAPAPLPHPDDIVINMKTGQVEIRGPMTKEEQEDWEKARTFKADHDAFVAEIEAMIQKRPKARDLSKTIERHRRINAALEAAVGPYAARMAEEERKQEAGPKGTDADMRVDRHLCALQLC